MPAETIYADLVLAVAALVAGVLYLRARRRHKAKKAGPPVRPATPTPRSAAPPALSPIQAPGVTTWAPPPPATPSAAVAPTVIAPPTASWDQPGPKPAAGGWSAGSPAPAWGAPGGAPGAPPRGPPPPSPPPPASRPARSRADVGCAHAIRSCTGVTRWTNLGRRSAAASS